MTAVSNQALCGGGNSNIGFFFAAVFPVGKDGMDYSFRLPVDFGLGGIALLDMEEMKKETSDIWEGGSSTKLDFTTTLDRGNHVLVVYGSEGCCDGTTSWSFDVNGDGWLAFTTANLDLYMDLEEELLDANIFI